MTDEITPPVEGQGEQQQVSWVDSLPTDMKGYVETKGFKDPVAVLVSYQNLEKLRGVPEAQLLKLPAKLDDAEGMAAVYDRLGRPESAEKYTQAVGVSDDVFKAIAADAHKLGLSDAQFAGLQKTTGMVAEKLREAEETATAAAFDQWKGSNGDGFTAAARVMATVGVDEKQLEGILTGDKVALYDFLARVGSRSSEAAVIQGEAPRSEFAMSPDAARLKVSELFADKDFMAAYTNPNERIRKPAIDRMSRLNQIVTKGN